MNVREAAATDARDGDEVEKVVMLRDVLGGTASVMPAGSNRAATWVDAEKVAAAMGSNAGRGGGGMDEVADALAAATQINEGSTL
uniref:SMP domain-containing protein n=1 Tax=Setaria italica TaxID=4555 RepID=K3ZLA7_SETIT